jgi:hypothetical protein
LAKLDQNVQQGRPFIPLNQFEQGAELKVYLSMVQAVTSKDFAKTPAMVDACELISEKIFEERAMYIPPFTMWQLIVGDLKTLSGGNFNLLSPAEVNESMLGPLKSSNKNSVQYALQQVLKDDTPLQELRSVTRTAPTSHTDIIQNIMSIRHIWYLAHGKAFALQVFHDARDFLDKLVIDIAGHNAQAAKHVADRAVGWICSNFRRLLSDLADDMVKYPKVLQPGVGLGIRNQISELGVGSFCIFGRQWREQEAS